MCKKNCPSRASRCWIFKIQVENLTGIFRVDGDPRRSNVYIFSKL